MSNVPAAGRERAEALVAAYASKAGAPDRELSEDDEATFGTVSLNYLADSDDLSIRVYVNAALLEGAPPEELENYKRIVGLLNDPAVGGMYEKGGGYFVLDEELQAYVLVRDIPVSQLNPRSLFESVEELEEAAAHWTTGWLGEVAMMMHGHRDPPARRVTYPDE